MRPECSAPAFRGVPRPALPSSSLPPPPQLPLLQLLSLLAALPLRWRCLRLLASTCLNSLRERQTMYSQLSLSELLPPSPPSSSHLKTILQVALMLCALFSPCGRSLTGWSFQRSASAGSLALTRFMVVWSHRTIFLWDCPWGSMNCRKLSPASTRPTRRLKPVDHRTSGRAGSDVSTLTMICSLGRGAPAAAPPASRPRPALAGGGSSIRSLMPTRCRGRPPKARKPTW
mmetsp:Transcript_84129/g.233149  ORF Transcript_84129/g.233149 Transcript_84129/m.233149 type:complete len:230 (-) Transcript_84129:1110-1799(-)